MIDILHALMHFFGLDDLSGPFYGFWSGVGSDISELAIVAAVIAGYRKHNCHVKGCWRLGKHAVRNTPYVVCAKHHPDVPDVVTPAHLIARETCLATAETSSDSRSDSAG